MDERSGIYEELENLLGTESAYKFVEYFAGSSIYIPKNLVTAQQYKRIKKEFNEGVSYRDLVKRYGYSDQHIRRIIQTNPKNF